MPTTETVRTDYRRWKKWKKNLYQGRQPSLRCIKTNKIETHNYVIICLFAPAPQLSLQIQVQISQKTWMRNVQFYYTYCYTKYRRIKSWNNSPSPPPPWKNALLKVPQNLNEKKHNLLIKVYRYHLSENDPLIKKNPQLLMLQIRKKKSQENKNVVLNKGWKIHKTNVKWTRFVSLFQ